MLVTACGPRNADTRETESTTKVTTTTTTAPADPAPPPAPDQVAPPPPPAMPSATLTQVNLDRVQKDMSPAQVEAILGTPTGSQSEPIPIVGGTRTTYNYVSGNSTVTIVFKNNLMMEKSGSFNP